MDVSYVVEPGTEAPRPEYEGGESYGTCTGGFVGYRGSTPGIITAQHCTSKPSTYDGATTGLTYAATNNYDVRFTALSGGTPLNKIKSGASTYTTITGVGVVSVGMWVAKYGKVTGYGSTTVKEYAGCVTYTDGKTWCGLYRTNGQITQNGDSGGPWFYVGRAYGIHSGSGTAGSLFTPIAYISYISGGVSVKTG